jgi:carbon storage regulator CsrA
MSLILSRKSGQSVIVDGCATITIYGSGNVRLKIDAPQETHVLRGELAQQETTDERGTLLDEFRAVLP